MCSDSSYQKLYIKTIMCRMFAKYCVYSVYVVLIYMRVTYGQTGPDFAMVKKGLTYFPVLSIPQDALSIDLTSNNIEQVSLFYLCVNCS